MVRSIQYGESMSWYQRNEATLKGIAAGLPYVGPLFSGYWAGSKASEIRTLQNQVFEAMYRLSREVPGLQDAIEKGTVDNYQNFNSMVSRYPGSAAALEFNRVIEETNRSVKDLKARLNEAQADLSSLQAIDTKLSNAPYNVDVAGEVNAIKERANNINFQS